MWWGYQPDTHNKHLEILDWERRSRKYVREAEETSPIACRALGKHDDRSISLAPDILERAVRSCLLSRERYRPCCSQSTK